MNRSFNLLSLSNEILVFILKMIVPTSAASVGSLRRVCVRLSQVIDTSAVRNRFPLVHINDYLLPELIGSSGCCTGERFTCSVRQFSKVVGVTSIVMSGLMAFF